MGQSFSCCLGRGEKAGDAGGTWDCADLAELSAGRQTTARCRKAAAAQDVEQRVLLDNSVPTQDLPEVKAPASQDQAQAGDEGGKGKTIRFRRSESALDVAERADGFASEDVPEVMASAAQAQARAQFGETGTPCDCGCPVELSGHLGKATQVVADCVVLTRNAPSNDRPEVMACSSQAQTEAGESEGRSDCQCPIEARGCMQTTIQLRAGESAQHVAERFIKENGSPAKDLPGVVACVSQAQAAGVDPKRGLDCVCLVELSGGKQMTVRWQQGESAQDVSERTVLEHFLSMKHMPEVLARVSEAQAQIVDPSGSSDRVCLVALSGGKQMTIRWRHGETAKTVAERVLMENALPTESLSEVVACVTKAQAKAGELAGNADRVCLVELSGGSNKAVQWQQEKFAQDVAEPALQEKALRAKGLPEAVACVSQAQAQSQAQTEDPEGRFDCICPVELSGGRKMTIRWREGESVQDVAERALHDSALPTKDLLEPNRSIQSSHALSQFTKQGRARLNAAANLQLALGELFLGELFRLRILLLRFLNGLLLLAHHHLDVARGGHVGAGAAVRTIGATSPLLSWVHLDMLDDEVVSVQIFELSVALGVGEQTQQNLGRFDRPTPLRHLEGLCLSRAPDTSDPLPEGHTLLLLAHVLEVPLRGLQIHALDCLPRLVGVLEVHPKVDTPGLAGLAGVARLTRILHHGCSYSGTPCRHNASRS